MVHVTGRMGSEDSGGVIRIVKSGESIWFGVLGAWTIGDIKIETGQEKGQTILSWV